MAKRALVGLALLACCAGCQRPAARTVDLNVWGVFIGPNDKGQNDVFREFERRNPGVRVKALTMGAGGMNTQKLMTAIAGGVPPDVVYQDRFALADWAARGAFQPLDGLIDRDRPTDPQTPTAEQYFPEPWRESTYQGKVYGIPWMADDRILVWNRQAFRERAKALQAAGLDPNRAPRTWSELKAYSRALTEFNPDGTLRRAGFIPNFGNSWFVMYTILNAAPLLSPDGKTCTLDSAEVAESVSFVKDCYDLLGGIENADRFASTFRGESSDAFFTGQVAMKIDGDWALGGIARYAPSLDFGSAPPPVPDDRLAKTGRFKSVASVDTTWAGGYAYSIPKGAKSAELAWKFLKFVTSTEGRMMEVRQQDLLNRSRGQMTFPRLTAQRETNELSLRHYLPKNPNLAEAVKLHFKLLQNAEVRPVSFAGKLLWDEGLRATDKAMRGDGPVRGYLTEAKQTVQRQLDAERQRDGFPVADLRGATLLGVAGLLLGGAVLWSRSGYRRLGRLGRIEARTGWLLVSPWVLGFVVLTAGPMLASLVLSFTEFNALQPAHWVGLKNFQELATDDRAALVKAFLNAFYLGGIGVPLGLVTGLALAMLLNSTLRGIGAFRTIFMLPTIVPGVASVVLWVWILSPDPKLGLVNGLWSQSVQPWFGAQTPGWFSSPDWAKPALVFMGLAGAGGGIVVWLAGLKGVPKELYEASLIDGARPGQQFWSVTLPQLSPLVFFNTVTGFIGALQVFDPVYVATGGYGAGPGDSLLVPVGMLFTHAFQYFRLGYASALAWVVFAVVMAVTAVQFLIGRRFVHYEADR